MQISMERWEVTLFLRLACLPLTAFGSILFLVAPEPFGSFLFFVLVIASFTASLYLVANPLKTIPICARICASDFLLIAVAEMELSNLQMLFRTNEIAAVCHGLFSWKLMLKSGRSRYPSLVSGSGISHSTARGSSRSFGI